jgi:hypothetical protein
MSQNQNQTETEEGAVSTGELTVVCGYCCGITSLLCTNCIGCTSEGMALCLRWECKGCRRVKQKNAHKTCCILCQGGQECVVPQTCCLVQQQFFCLDQRCAFPSTKEAPCIVTVLPGCTLCVAYKPKVACCKKLKVLTPDNFTAPAPAEGTTIVVIQQPPQVQMVRSDNTYAVQQ